MDGQSTIVDSQLSLVGSENRARLLIAKCIEADVEEARRLLREWFNVCDALAPWRFTLREQFERVGWVTDTEEAPPVLPATVYRAAWIDDDVANALSWTTDIEVAKRFLTGLVSPRAMFLGIYREGIEAVVFEGSCTEAFGYLNSREESEVIARKVIDIRPVLMLAKKEENG